MCNIFISYARGDAGDFVLELIADLELIKNKYIPALNIWVDQFDVPGGAEFLKAIKVGITECDLFVAVRTSAANQSHWVACERLLALELGKLIVPILPIVPYIKDKVDRDLELITLSELRYTPRESKSIESLKNIIESSCSGATSPSHIDVEIDQRTIEEAYLGRILQEYKIWEYRYVSTFGAQPGAISQFSPQAQYLANASENEIVEHPDLLQSVEALRQVVVLGEPGAGKTTTLWYLAWEMASRAIENETLPIPVLLELGYLEGNRTIDSEIRARLGDLSKYYDTLKDKNRITFLIDGINELQSSNREQILQNLAHIIEWSEDNNIILVMTCRELDYNNINEINVVGKLWVNPLDPARIYDLLPTFLLASQQIGSRHQANSLGDQLFWKLAGGANAEDIREVRSIWEEYDYTIQHFFSFDEVPSEVVTVTTRDQDELWRQTVHSDRSVLHLITNPYLLQMVLRILGDHKVPDSRDEVISQFIDSLINYESDSKLLKQNLGTLAYEIFERREGPSISRKDAIAFLGGESNLFHALNANILVGSDKINFSHAVLLEHFAALELKNLIDRNVHPFHIWHSEKWWEATGWEELALILAGLSHEARGSLVDWLIIANPELAARCILKTDLSPNTVISKELRTEWLKRMIDMDAEPHPASRAALGRALGLLDMDDRVGIGLNHDGLPDIEWINIPEGQYQFGESDSSNCPESHITIQGFHIAKYPISNKQFQSFVNHPDGYKQDKWWKDLKFRGGLSSNMIEAYPNHPCVSVSWYEAIAFCRWLSEQLGVAITLPTIQQWEKAARGTQDQRNWPWGPNYISGSANVDETVEGVGDFNLGLLAPIGIYPLAESPFGVQDMCGNIWEWCLNTEPDNAEIVLPGNKTRTRRGGSWAFYHKVARISYCVARNNPRQQNVDFGFRCVLLDK